MNLLGIHLTLLIGQTVPTPAPLALVEALRSVEVTHNDQGSSGFQMTFQVGRSSILDLLDYRLLTNPRLKPFNRVIILVRFAIVPQVLMDGIITSQQLSPSSDPGGSTLTITGEDVSVMMDLEENPREHPAMPDNVIVTRLVAPYIPRFLLAPRILPAPRFEVPNPLDYIPQQSSNYTDRTYIQMLARRHGYLFYITPGPTPGSNSLYWGPPERLNEPQPALSVNMGPNTNVETINFQYNALAPNKVVLATNETTRTLDSYSPPPVRLPLVRDRANLRRTVIWNEASPQAEAQAQGMVDQSLDDVVTASGELDTLRYNGLLKPRGLVGLRGVGQTYDGLYYVKNVTHNISKGQYKQRFTLTREGTGTLTPLVRP